MKSKRIMMNKLIAGIQKYDPNVVYMTCLEASMVVGCGRNSIWRAAHEGRLPYYWGTSNPTGRRRTRAYLFHPSDVSDFSKAYKKYGGRHKYRLTKLEIKKIKQDTGGGCSICGNLPVVNVDGSYWLCGTCVREKIIPTL